MHLFTTPSRAFEKDIEDLFEILKKKFYAAYKTATEREARGERSYDQYLSYKEYKEISDKLRVAFADLQEQIIEGQKHHEKYGLSEEVAKTLHTFEQRLNPFTQITLNDNLHSIREVSYEFLRVLHEILHIKCNPNDEDGALKMNWHEVTNALAGQLELEHHRWENKELVIWKAHIDRLVTIIATYLIGTQRKVQERKRVSEFSTDPFLAPKEFKNFSSTIRQDILKLRSLLDQVIQRPTIQGVNSEQIARAQRLHEHIRDFFKIGELPYLKTISQITIFFLTALKNSFPALDIKPYDPHNIEYLDHKKLTRQLIIDQEWMHKSEKALEKFIENLLQHQKNAGSVPYSDAILDIKEHADFAKYFLQEGVHLHSAGLSDKGELVCNQIITYLDQFLTHTAKVGTIAQIMNSVATDLQGILGTPIVIDKDTAQKIILATAA